MNKNIKVNKKTKTKIAEDRDENHKLEDGNELEDEDSGTQRQKQNIRR